MTVVLRPMGEADLPLVVRWLAAPHVVRWWHQSPTLDEARAKYLPRIAGDDATRMLIVLDDGVPAGLAQWYRWDDYAADRNNYRIGAGELGFDYAIGESSACGRGVGTQLIAALLDELRAQHDARTPVAVTPEADNAASRRVLAKNGFELVEVFQSAQLPGHAPEGPTALYRRRL
jgi:RimJ/RimL family protein N-acetyltransferase